MNAPRLFAATVGTLICFPLLAPPASAAVSLTFTSQTIDFDTDFPGSNNGQFSGAGFASNPDPGQLDSDAWRVTGLSDGNSIFGGTETTGDFARGSSAGGVTFGGIYAFDVGGGDIALGVQPSTDFTPGAITLRLQNDTGSFVSSVAVAWDVYILNDQGRANSFNFSWSTDDSSYPDPPPSELTSAATADGSPSWQRNPFSLTLTGLNLGPGANLYLQWAGDDVSGGGSRDEFALDNITFSAIPASSAIPEPTSALVGLLLATALLRRRRG